MPRLFRSLFRRSAAPTTDPYTAFLEHWNLTASELAALRSMRDDAGWPVMLKLLDARLVMLGDAVLAPRAHDDVAFLRGQATGIHESVRLVDEIIHKEQELARHAADARERKRGAVPADAHTVNTPAFRTRAR